MRQFPLSCEVWWHLQVDDDGIKERTVRNAVEWVLEEREKGNREFIEINNSWELPEPGEGTGYRSSWS